MKSIASLQAKLLNLSKEQGVAFQILLNRFGSEQFLYRLSISEYVDNFVFKGGSLLLYLINSNRKTRDLDFSITEISNQVDDSVEIVKIVTSIKVDDGIKWKDIVGKPLNHPEMKSPGGQTPLPFFTRQNEGGSSY